MFTNNLKKETNLLQIHLNYLYKKLIILDIAMHNVNIVVYFLLELQILKDILKQVIMNHILKKREQKFRINFYDYEMILWYVMLDVTLAQEKD